MAVKKKSFVVVRHLNSPNTAEYRGLSVQRREKIFIPEFSQFVMCAPYDNHFIFEVPKRLKDSSFRCTCGSPAVVVGSLAYKHDASPTDTGRLLVCMIHAAFGRHATGESRWI